MALHEGELPQEEPSETHKAKTAAWLAAGVLLAGAAAGGFEG
jgi:hypothetical protein